MGVGIVASIALDPARDRDLRTLDAGHLFQINVTGLGLRRGAWLRDFAYDFIETFCAHAQQGHGAARRGQRALRHCTCPPPHPPRPINHRPP